MGGLLMFCGERMFAAAGRGRYRRFAEPFVRQLLAIDRRAQRNPDDGRAPDDDLQHPGSQKRVYTRHIGPQERTRECVSVAGDRTQRLYRRSGYRPTANHNLNQPSGSLVCHHGESAYLDAYKPYSFTFNGNTQSNRILGSLAGKCDICYARGHHFLYDHESLLRPVLQFIQLFRNRAHGNCCTAEPPRTTSPGQTTPRGGQTSAGST